MTTNDLKNAAAEIEAKFYELGGKKEFFSSFLMTLGQSIEFGLNAEWVEIPLDLVSQWFNPRFTGAKEKFSLREVVGKINNPDSEKTYSILDKKYI